MGWCSPFSSHVGKVPGAQALGSLWSGEFLPPHGLFEPQTLDLSSREVLGSPVHTTPLQVLAPLVCSLGMGAGEGAGLEGKQL